MLAQRGLTRRDVLQIPMGDRGTFPSFALTCSQ